MIYIKTELWAIPKACNKCPYYQQLAPGVRCSSVCTALPGLPLTQEIKVTCQRLPECPLREEIAK